MTPRAKIVTGLVLAVLLSTGLWLLTRSRRSQGVSVIGPQNPAVVANAALPDDNMEVAEHDVRLPVTSGPVSSPASGAAPAGPAMPASLPVSTRSFLPPATVSSELAAGEAAAARMYAAHAPLRTLEVADPDSATNKRILGAMVAKALAQPTTPPPSAVGEK